MASSVRSVNFLPEIFQTPVNKQFLSATLDQLIQEPNYKQTQGYIGQRVGPGVNPADNYVVEPNKVRRDYQLEPGVVILDPVTGKYQDAITYPGILDAISVQGGYTNKADRLFESEYYTWDPFVNFDKFSNYAQYYWLPGGPLSVTVEPVTIPTTASFTVTRANGAYTIAGYAGNNPSISLLRNGSYEFDIAQITGETVNHRVTDNGTSGWNIDGNASENPLILVRGNTYIFNLVQSIPLSFYIKTEESFGTTNLWTEGVTNNGATQGLVSFTVPQDAPSTLYYCNDVEFNFRGEFSIVDPVADTGPKFWIQAEPGIDGTLSWSPNISSRSVLGVSNNGIDLGTVQFDVPSATAQNFYYTMPYIGYPTVTTGVVSLVASTLEYNQINNISVADFFDSFPGGIDGVTDLNGRSVVFLSTTGWGSVTSVDVQRSVWQIQYVDVSGTSTIQLTSVQEIDNLSQFSINYGTEYINTRWFKNSSGLFEEQPLLTAASNTLYYQDSEDPTIFGSFNIVEESIIDVDTDILGHEIYTSPNGVTFTNGLKITFKGNVVPESYQNNTYFIDGVGEAITLTPASELLTPEAYITDTVVPYDSLPYAYGPYNDVNGIPLEPDYITMALSSPDRNAWARANRWFHVDVINAAAAYNGVQPMYTNAQRATRPILEFRGGTKLFNYGTEGIPPVNIIDFTQTDALLTVNGSAGYSTDGYTLAQDSLVIFAADTSSSVRNQIYRVNFIDVDANISTVPLIDLVPVSYSPALVNQITVCTNGDTLSGISFYYDGDNWVKAQQKTKVNQPPLFDVYDNNGYSFGDIAQYPSTNFVGSKLFSYAENPDNPVDSVLGFPLAFYTFNNIGDILFDNNLYTDTFVYTVSGVGTTVDVSSGFVHQYADRLTYTTEIGWQTAAIPSLSRQQFQFSYDGNPLQLDILAETSMNVPAVQVFINDVFQLASTYTVSVDSKTNTTVITLTGTGYVANDIIEVMVYSDQTSAQGFYEIPVNLENNPFNGNSKQLSLGQIRQHYGTICQNLVGFSGIINGQNNTRDLGNIVPYGQQILQQSSPLTLAGYFLRSLNYNVFAAIEYNSREYTKYKTKLLNAVTQINIQPGQSVSSILDLAVQNINSTLTSIAPFYWSDMFPAGTNYISNKTIVNPLTIQTFNTVQTYDFTKSNYLGLLVYLNGVLLTRGTEYTVSPDAPKLTILVPLSVGDEVIINEYPTTVPNWCPNTPSKMGLYPKYRPEIFLDETYAEPTVVIRGHDGSITVAFDDIRDQVLLEFEKRIYNNIKVDDNPIPLTTDEVDPTFYPAQTTGLLPGFFRQTPYTYEEVNTILSESFLTWVGQNKVDYTSQTYDINNPFTYNYSTSANRLNNQVFQQGNWRGIYRYFYDTETPNTTPWEMVGFSEMPTWWEFRYGPAPYTSGNKVLWDDLEAGIVGDPSGPYVLPEYIRPGLSRVIPSGSEGELLPPLEAVVGGYDPSGFQQSWKAGDGGPTQASWWKSSNWPFAMMRLLAITKPAQFFSLYADRDLYRYNTTLGQFLYNGRYRLDASGIEIYGTGTSKASYINWIVDYNQQTGVNSSTELSTALANLDVRLCYRMASFSDEEYVRLFTERAGPASNNNTLNIPQNSYDIVFYKNQPFGQITYSSVIVEVTQLGSGGVGYTVHGYSNSQPYFETLVSSPFGRYVTITSGGTSVQVPVQYTTDTQQIPYGYTFTSQAAVCNFLLSYGAYLESQGIVFNNVYNNYTLNWNQMCQEFLYFATQGWTESTIINLNPCATQISASRPISIIDTIASVAPENMLLNQNHQALNVRDLIVRRDGANFSILSTTGQTINYLTLKYTNYEDMIVLNNVTQYNDLIYDPVTAARQTRLGLIASTTTEWDGQLNAQGFILNLNNVKQWQSYTKYTKGEMVLYKNTYWQAIVISEPQETFNYAEWVKSDYQLVNTGLLPNLANKADQLTTAYDIYQANLTSDNDLFAFGLIGFRPRKYMTEMNLNDVTQVQIYQQFLGTKGTLRAAEIFSNAKLTKESGQYNIYENWGILSGTYGAQANKSFVELQLNESLLQYNPSTVQVINPGEVSSANQTIYVNDLWKESYAITSANILPTTYENTKLPEALPSAGYVCLDDVDVTVFDIKNPAAIAADIDNIGIGTYIWIAKVNSYDWGIYRVGGVPGQLTQIADNLNSTAIAQFTLPHGLTVGDLIVIKYFNESVNGVYRVLATPTPKSITISYTFTNSNATTITGNGLVYELQSARVKQASDIPTLKFINELIPGAKVWVDNNGNGHWQAVQKQEPFLTDSTIIPGLTAPSQYGSSVSQTTDTLGMLVGAPGSNNGAGSILVYVKGVETDYFYSSDLTLDAEGTVGYGNMVSFGKQNWAIAGASASFSNTGYATVIYRDSSTGECHATQLLLPPDDDTNPINFGYSGIVSEDERWIYVGAPAGNKVYAYQRVDVEHQTVTYIANGTTELFNWNNSIQVDYTYPKQLVVSIGKNIATEGSDYTVDANYVQFTTPPAPGQEITITRREEVQLDQQTYYYIEANITSGSGFSAAFNIKNTRGQYSTSVVSGGIGYTVGEVLVIYGSAIGGGGNLVITVATIDDIGAITGFTTTGSGIGNTTTFYLNQWLYTASDINAFGINVNGQVQRPNLDYTFNQSTSELVFTTVPPLGAVIVVEAGTHWEYVSTISLDILTTIDFGKSVTATTDGRQIFVGAPYAQSGNVVQAGMTYTFDRSVLRYIVDNPADMTYTVPGTITGYPSVIVNNVFLLSTEQSLSGQYSVSGNTITFTNIEFNYGDIIEIETNQFSLIQQISSHTPTYEAQFGTALAACPLDCSIYVGAPFDSTYVPQAGSVDHLVNQSRVYGVTITTKANPTLTANGTLRINDTEVSVPNAPNNTVSGFAEAINAASIPNVIASTTANMEFIGDGITKIFNVGSIYTDASAYNTVVYVSDVLQTAPHNYTYDETTTSINFVYAPMSGEVITVVSGRLVISVKNVESATPRNMLTVLPGVVDSVFDELGFETYAFTQQILSPAPTQYGQFGNAISVDSNAINLVVGSKNGNVYEPNTFDGGKTYFDDHSTLFSNPVLNSGVAYTYDYFPSSVKNINNPGQFAFGQQIYNKNCQSGDNFGVAVDYVSGKLVVGATGGTTYETHKFGYATVYNNPTNTPAWKTIRIQEPVVDVYAINGVFAYDGAQAIGVNTTVNSDSQTYLDFFDPLQGKILGIARQNIDYIGAVDPAQYNVGTIHNNGVVWGADYIGQMWWDTDTVRFIDPNQDDITYASRRWGSTFPGSSVDVYQWIEDVNPPMSYTGIGTPLSVTSYSVASKLDINNVFQTYYYYWVRGITSIAQGAGKTLSANGVASYILDPRSSGLPYMAGLNASTIALYNTKSLLTGVNTVLNIGFDRKLNDDVVHQEYQVITAGETKSFLTAQLYRKLLDSFCGIDTAGAAVPDPTVSPGMRYGVQFRPRQSMFADRYTALKNYLTRANLILSQYPIAETRSFNLLNASQPKPESTAYNMEVPNLTVLGYQDLAEVPVGYIYLVDSDSDNDGRWTMYQVQENKTLLLIQVQGYDTSLYWYYTNWYLPGYNYTIPSVAAVTNYSQLSTLSYELVPVGSTVRVTTNGVGKWEIYMRTGIDPVKDWQRVAVEDGTIAFKEDLWDYNVGNFGFDDEVFDAQYFDQTPQIETRYILRALNEEIYVGDLALERNSSLILMFNFIYSEFTNPSWLIKTSYVNVNHNIRQLQPYQTYLEDNQTFILDYFQEVKPYHVQVRNFNLIYNGDDEYLGDVTDYDLPAYWNTELTVPQFTSPILTPYDTAITPHYSTASDAAPNAQIWQPPFLYNEWFTNYLLSLESVVINNVGAGYTSIPQVVVTGDSLTPAVMTASINSVGQIEEITIVDPGSGYTTTPIITIVGGGLPVNPTAWSAGLTVTSNSYIIARGNNIYRVTTAGVLGEVAPVELDIVVNGTATLAYIGTNAVVAPVLGNPLVRSIKTTIKYDRCEYHSTIVDWEINVTYINGTLVRNYNTVWEANGSEGSVTQTVFDPSEWIEIDPSTLSGADRTMGYYVSTPNLPGLSLPLLIDGIDYPGVQVMGLNFINSPGFDRAPFDTVPFENLSYDASGRPTYDLDQLDTIFASSYLDQYLGTRTSDINVDGGAYVDTFSSHAPEELVPGIEFDTLDLRVYTSPGADWLGLGHGFPMSFTRFSLDDTLTYSFTGLVEHPVTVFVINETTQVDLHIGTDYTVDWTTQSIGIVLQPDGGSNIGDVIGVYVCELGGGNQLYQQIYNGAEVGDSLVVPVQYDLIQEFAIFVNGSNITDFTFADNSDVIYGTTLITFDNTYTDTDFVNLTAIGPTQIGDTTYDYSWSIPLAQTIIAEADAYTYGLTNSLDYTNPAVAIVTLNGRRLRTAAGIDHIGDDVTTTFSVAQRLGFSQDNIISDEVIVYVDSIPQDSSTYTVNPDSNGTTVTFDTAPVAGARIYIAVTTQAQAVVDLDPVTREPLNTLTISGVTPIDGDVINVITFNDTREQRLITNVFVGPLVEGEALDTEGYDTTLFDTGNITNDPGSFDYASQGTFVADTTLDSNVITDITNFFGLTVGTYIAGPGIQIGSVIETVDVPGGSITISKTATATATGVTLTYGTTYVENELVLNRTVTDISRLWVTLNGRILNPDVDFTISNDLEPNEPDESGSTIILPQMLGPTDIVIVTQMTQTVVPEAMEFRIFQDMRGVQATYRMTPSTTTSLVDDITSTDDIIYVADASALTEPDFAANAWGVITINGERIMYRERDTVANTVSSLLRGTAGTAAADHTAGAIVYDMGRGNLMPEQFQNYIVSDSFLGNGTTVTFTGENIHLTYQDAELYGTVPFDTGSTTGEPGSYDYGIGDPALALEVYVGGERQMDNYTVDVVNPATITLDVAPPAGVEVTLLIRRGVDWYQPGAGTPSNGFPLQVTDTVAAKFLRGE